MKELVDELRPPLEKGSMRRKDFSSSVSLTFASFNTMPEECPDVALAPSTRSVRPNPQTATSKASRDNFSMLGDDCAVIDELRRTVAMVGKTETTKGAVPLAGLRALKKMSPEQLL